jgi:hypothetical protein
VREEEGGESEGVERGRRSRERGEEKETGGEWEAGRGEAEKTVLGEAAASWLG